MGIIIMRTVKAKPIKTAATNKASKAKPIKKGKEVASKKVVRYMPSLAKFRSSIQIKGKPLSHIVNEGRR
jgi:hypothetical protein